MTYERLAYDDADTTGQMHDDAAACGSRIRLLRTGDRLDVHPSGLVLDRAPRKTKREIEVSEAAAYLASRLHLHLD